MLTPRPFEAPPVLATDPDMRRDIVDQDDEEAEAAQAGARAPGGSDADDGADDRR